jgi:hypothetical protein
MRVRNWNGEACPYPERSTREHRARRRLTDSLRAELERRGIRADDSDDKRNGVYTDTHDHPRGMRLMGVEASIIARLDSLLTEIRRSA